MACKLSRSIPLLLTVLASWSGPVEALRFYVDQSTGDDRRSHVVVQESETPWKTITHALKVAHIINQGRPHVIDIAPGTYSPSTGETFPFVISQTRIHFRSQGNVILDAQRKSRVIEITAPNANFSLRNFSLVNGTGERGGAVFCQTCTLRVVGSRMLNNVATDGGDAFFVDDGQLTVTNNIIRLNGESGSTGPVIEARNTFTDTTKRDVIRNNTFYHNRTPAILTTGNRTDISSNIFVGTPGDGVPAIIDSAAGIEPLVRYNLFWDTDILYLSADRDSVKAARTVQDTITLGDQGVEVPDFVTNVPDTVAQVDSQYEFDIEVTGTKDSYNFNVISETEIPEGMSAVDADAGILRWTPTASQIGRHAVRLEIVTPQGQLNFLSYVITVFTAEDFPDTTTPAPVIVFFTVPDTSGAIDSLNTILPVFSDGISAAGFVSGTRGGAGGNVYADPLFLNPDINRFELLTTRIDSRTVITDTDTTVVNDTLLSVARDAGNPFVGVNDAVIAGGQVRNDMGETGGPETDGPPTPGTHTETSVTNVPDSVAIEGQPWTYDPVFDPEGRILIIDLLQGPPTMGDVFGSGKERPPVWTPAVADTGTYLVGVQTFLDNGSPRHYFPLRVRAANARPRIVSTPPTSAPEDAALAYAIEAVDDDGDTLSYSVQSGPDGLTVDSLGVVRWTPTQADVDSIAVDVVILITDSGGVTNTHAFSLLVTDANDAPVIATLTDTTATEDLVFRRTPVFSDEDPSDSVFTFSLGTAPDSLTVDSLGVLAWTPVQADVGEHVVTFRVHDPAGAVDSASFTLTVTEVDDPPTVTSTPDTTAPEDQLYEYAVTAADEEGLALSYALGTAPQGMVIDTTGRVQWTPALADTGVHSVEVRASDPGGQAAIQSYQLTVLAVNDAPAILSRTPPDSLVLIDPGEEVTLGVTVSDEEEDPLAFQWLVNGLLSGTEATFLLVPDTTSADTVVLRVDDGADTTSTSWIVDARAIARVSVSTDTVAFGAVALGDTAKVVRTVSNPGRSTLVISNLQVGDLTYAAQFGTGQVLKGDSTTLELQYVPVVRGVDESTIQFATNDPDVPTVVIPVSGSGIVPTLVELDFDLAPGGQSLQTRSGRVGSSFELDVDATEALDLVGYALELDFDPAALSFSAFSDSAGATVNLLGDGATFLVSTPTGGQVRIDAAATRADSGTSGDGTLGRLTFALLAGAEVGSTTAIRLSRVELSSAGLVSADVLVDASDATLDVASALAGDFNDDDVVDFDDFFIFADAFGTDDPQADLDSSGLVDFDDFFAFADVFGSSARPLPETAEDVAGLALDVERAGTSGHLQTRVSWRGEAPLRGAALWVAFDPRHLAFEELSTADESVVWSQDQGPGTVSIAVARTQGAPFETDVGTLRFRRLTASATEVRLDGALGRLDGRVVGLAAPDPAAVDALPRTAVLYPAYPNPFNPETVIPLFVPAGEEAGVRVLVYDLLGRPVRTLVSTPLAGGHHRLVWRGRDDDGRAVAAGVYLVELRATDLRQMRKILLLK